MPGLLLVSNLLFCLCLLTLNQKLEAEVLDLKTGLEAIEERARTDLGMIKNDEVYYQVIDNKEKQLKHFKSSK